MELSCYQIRTTINFQFYRKKSATESHQIMCTVSGTNFVSCDNVKVLYQKFKNKDYDIQETEHSDYPIDVDEAQLQELVEEDQYATT